MTRFRTRQLQPTSRLPPSSGLSTKPARCPCLNLSRDRRRRKAFHKLSRSSTLNATFPLNSRQNVGRRARSYSRGHLFHAQTTEPAQLKNSFHGGLSDYLFIPALVPYSSPGCHLKGKALGGRRRPLLATENTKTRRTFRIHYPVDKHREASRPDSR